MHTSILQISMEHNNWPSLLYRLFVQCLNIVSVFLYVALSLVCIRLHDPKFTGLVPSFILVVILFSSEAYIISNYITVFVGTYDQSDGLMFSSILSKALKRLELYIEQCKMNKPTNLACCILGIKYHRQTYNYRKN